MYKGVIYDFTKNGTYELCGNIENLGVKIIDQGNRTIEEETCVNGTFFWRDNRGVTYPTSILYANNTIYQYRANHYPNAQSVFIVYKDNSVNMIRIKDLSELNLNDIKLAIGGVGIRNTLNKSFKYNPYLEGFKGAYADVLRCTNKTVIGYNKAKNKVYLMARKNIYHSAWWRYDLLDLCRDLGYDIALSLDGGGSTFLNNSTDMIVYGDGRRINNIIGFNL